VSSNRPRPPINTGSQEASLLAYRSTAQLAHRPTNIMCLILLAIDQHPDYPWLIAANRDEFRERPTAPLGWWRDHPQVLAGRDLAAGGTWMGLTRKGRFAAVTNYRETRSVFPRGPSRGALVSDFLTGEMPPEAYLKVIATQGQRYNGFNLVLGDTCSGLFYYGNRGIAAGSRSHDAPNRLTPGIYGLSNHRLDTPWPKVERGKRRVADCLATQGRAQEEGLTEALFDVLADRSQPDDADLPDTGVGLTWERILAPLFINNPHYGTRSCSVVRLDHRDHLTIVERTIPQPGHPDPLPVDRRVQFHAAAAKAATTPSQ
jgi:uncharacterized protein with NRDE domain